ncbi:MAG: hypothetical protein FK733_11280, partial [Asgard group archaeon]|nr:hypothetical protein [Asgard group archaeon]
MQLDEIRLNNKYATFSLSDYDNGEMNESKPIINKKTIRTSELIQKINNVSDLRPREFMIDHLFPPNCRYYEEHPEGYIVLIEEPPAFRTISIDKDMSNEVEALKSIGKLKEYGYENWKEENPKRPYTFNVALPFTIFMLVFSKNFDFLNGMVFFRNKQISGFSDPLCKTPFLNVNSNQSVCFGGRVHKGPKRSIFSDTTHVINVFWSAIFNTDYIYNYVDYQEVAGVCDYLTWEYYSHTDPMFIYKVDWLKSNYTIESSL